MPTGPEPPTKPSEEVPGTEPTGNAEATPVQSKSPSGSRRWPEVLAVVVAAGLALVLVVPVLRGPPEAPPLPPAHPVVPESPSQYPLCRGLQDMFKKRQAELGCETDGWEGAGPICEAPFKGKPGCRDKLETAVSCLKSQPASAYRCVDGSLSFDPAPCAEQLKPFVACLNPPDGAPN